MVAGNGSLDLTTCLDGVEVGRRTGSIDGQALDAVCLADCNLLDFICHGRRVKKPQGRRPWGGGDIGPFCLVPGIFQNKACGQPYEY